MVFVDGRDRTIQRLRASPRAKAKKRRLHGWQFEPPPPIPPNFAPAAAPPAVAPAASTTSRFHMKLRSATRSAIKKPQKGSRAGGPAGRQRQPPGGEGGGQLAPSSPGPMGGVRGGAPTTPHVLAAGRERCMGGPSHMGGFGLKGYDGR